jgi:hypothetical protein
MAKLTKDEMVSNVVDLYVQTPEVWPTIVSSIKNEMQRQFDLLGIGQVNWAQFRMDGPIDANLVRRVVNVWAEQKTYKWLCEWSKINAVVLKEYNLID